MILFCDHAKLLGVGKQSVLASIPVSIYICYGYKNKFYDLQIWRERVKACASPEKI